MIVDGLRELKASIYEEAIESCRGKIWFFRFLLLIWLVYSWFKFFNDSSNWNVLNSIDFCVHEFGHLLFSPFGQFIGVAGGTILQCLVPLLVIVGFYKEKEFFGISLSFGWLAVNFLEIARYAADARAMALPLFNPLELESVIHDWNYLLGQIGILPYDTVLAAFIKMFSIFLILLCIISGGWLLLRMARQGN